MKYSRLLLSWMVCLWLATVYALPAIAGDSLRISLITCGAGSSAYEVYGHTALRVQNDRTGEDWIFNYGVFDFDRPGFIWRFVLGETDYMLDVMPFGQFKRSYAASGRYVDEQVLNLTAEEKERLAALLYVNYLPENRVYRYDFFYKNCTTQARDIVDSALAGRFAWPENAPRSYRDILHEFTSGQPWLQFGQDLLIGTEADEPLDTYGQDFVPILFERDMARASIISPAGEERPAVLQTRQHVPQDTSGADASTWLSPRKVFVAWFVVALGVAVWQIAKRKNLWWFDLPFLALQGVAGCIITFLFLFSTHPGVDSNWLIVVLNPIPLFYLPWAARNAARTRCDYYHVAAPLVIWGFTLLSPLTGQDIPVEALLFVNGLALLSVARFRLTFMHAHE